MSRRRGDEHDRSACSRCVSVSRMSPRTRGTAGEDRGTAGKRLLHRSARPDGRNDRRAWTVAQLAFTTRQRSSPFPRGRAPLQPVWGARSMRSGRQTSADVPGLEAPHRHGGWACKACGATAAATGPGPNAAPVLSRETYTPSNPIMSVTTYELQLIVGQLDVGWAR